MTYYNFVLKNQTVQKIISRHSIKENFIMCKYSELNSIPNTFYIHRLSCPMYIFIVSRTLDLIQKETKINYENQQIQKAYYSVTENTVRLHYLDEYEHYKLFYCVFCLKLEIHKLKFSLQLILGTKNVKCRLTVMSGTAACDDTWYIHLYHEAIKIQDTLQIREEYKILIIIRFKLFFSSQDNIL